jgi:endonuclease III
MDITPERLPQKADTDVVELNRAHAYTVLDELSEAYFNHQYPYSLESTQVPQDERNMPKTLERGGREHAMFLWNVCAYMRGGTQSGFAVKALGKLYDSRPDLFLPETIITAPRHEIVDQLTSVGLGFQETASKQWHQNSQLLLEKYDGDPRNVFEGIDTYDGLVDRVKNKGKNKGGFLGFREKMTSMAAYYLMEAGLVEAFPFPVPVDIHVMRVSIANQFVTFPEAALPSNVLSEKLLKVLRDLYLDYSADRDINPIDLSNMVWLLSDALCSNSPGNRVTEPNGRANRIGRKTLVLPTIVNPDNPSHVRQYDKTCGRCPVEYTCELNVLGGASYNALGRVVIQSPRLRVGATLFPQAFLNETT